MKTILTLVASVGVLGVTTAAEQRPNIIIFLAEESKNASINSIATGTAN